MYYSLIIFSPSLLDKLTKSTETISQKLSVEEGKKTHVLLKWCLSKWLFNYILFTSNFYTAFYDTGHCFRVSQNNREVKWLFLSLTWKSYKILNLCAQIIKKQGKLIFSWLKFLQTLFSCKVHYFLTQIDQLLEYLQYCYL